MKENVRLNKNSIIISSEYISPEKSEIEIVERKGIGHPDTLADGIAEAISIEYSKVCIEKFGHVLHHNVDKLYIGAGKVERDFGKYKVIEPIKIVVNGRMSDMFGNQKLDIKKIQIESAKKYIKQIIPQIDAETDVVVEANATQICALKNWYKPESINDLPEATRLVANDTSVCVSHYPFTIAERLAYELEKHFWEKTNKQIIFTYKDIGQDIKVMVFRKGKDFDITMCIPLLSTFTNSKTYYLARVKELEKCMLSLATEIVGDKLSTISLTVNPPLEKPYILGLGSCVENGEEGLVGRGNSLNGIISICRPHSMEAFSGKNPVYHTGRVLGYLTEKLAKAIYEETGCACNVTSMTKNGWSLLPPYLLSIMVDKRVDKKMIVAIIGKNYINCNYLEEVIEKSLVLREGDLPWSLNSSAISVPVEQQSTITAK